MIRMHESARLALSPRTTKSSHIVFDLPAGAASTFVLWHAGANCVGTVAVDEPTALVGDDRPELDSHETERASE